MVRSRKIQVCVYVCIYESVFVSVSVSVCVCVCAIAQDKNVIKGEPRSHLSFL
jgi:hypothetical protein